MSLGAGRLCHDLAVHQQGQRYRVAIGYAAGDETHSRSICDRKRLNREDAWPIVELEFADERATAIDTEFIGLLHRAGRAGFVTGDDPQRGAVTHLDVDADGHSCRQLGVHAGIGGGHLDAVAGLAMPRLARAPLSSALGALLDGLESELAASR